MRFLTERRAAVARAMTASGAQRATARRVLEKRYLYLLMIPSYLFVIIFSYQPAFSALYHAFFWWNGVRTRWVGLDNFAQMGRDPYFLNAVWNMVQLTIFQVVIHLTIPLLVATLISRLRNERLAYWYQVLLVIPMAVPGVVTYLIWKWFYSYDGLINIVLRGAGYSDAARAWLGEPNLALFALMLVGFPWAGGMAMLVFLAGLQQIPREVIDAAIVDGIGPFNRFIYIELPLVLGQVRMLLILFIIGGLQQFTLPLVMTSGGPGWATMVPGLRLFQTVSNEFQYGYGSAIGVTLFAAILVLTYVNQRYLRSSVEYEPTK